MNRSRTANVSAGEKAALHTTAMLILERARTIAAPPAKDRALELARLVLGEAPRFGGREMRDAEILATLQAEQISPATFKKALTTARKELAKKPSSLQSKRGKRSADRRESSGSGKAPQVLSHATAGSSMALNLDRNTL